MYILDTDHTSLYQQGHSALGRRLQQLPPNQLAVTVITFEEQVAGRLAMIHKARNAQQRIQAYAWLQRTLRFYCEMPVLPFDEPAAAQMEILLALRLRAGTHDLSIASIALVNGMTLLTRNIRDFQRVPGLVYADWSVP